MSPLPGSSKESRMRETGFGARACIFTTGGRIDGCSREHHFASGLIGQFRVELGTANVTHVERRTRAASLLKLLVLTSGRALHREHLAELLWPDCEFAYA